MHLGATSWKKILIKFFEIKQDFLKLVNLLKYSWRRHIGFTWSADSGMDVPVVIVNRERVRTLIMVNDAIQTDEPDENVATGGTNVVAETEC